MEEINGVIFLAWQEVMDLGGLIAVDKDVASDVTCDASR